MRLSAAGSVNRSQPRSGIPQAGYAKLTEEQRAKSAESEIDHGHVGPW